MPGAVPLNPKFQFSNNGVPMVNGTVTVYLAGTTTPTNTWKDAAQTILNTNPIVLDARGEAVIYLDPALSYKFVLKSAAGVTQWTQDSIAGGGSAAAIEALRASLAAVGGSSLVGFQQSGTGAVARTAQDKMRESVSVLDFGAVGNGVADDTVAIQAAFNSGAKVVRFPAGLYKTTATLNKPMGVLMLGDGAYSSIITAAHNGSILKIGSATFAGDTFNSVESLGFTNSATFNSAIGIEVLSVNQIGMKKIRITGGPAVGLRFINVLNSQVDELTVSDCGDVGIYLFSAGLATGTNTCTFNKVNNSYCLKGVVIDCDGGLQNTFNNLVVEGTTSYPVQVDNCQQLTFNNLYLEGNAFSVILQGGNDITFRDVQNVSNIQFIESAPASTNVFVERLYSPGAIPMVVSPNVTTFNNKAIENITGIRFSASAVPSADPNTLDDYREATWTPIDLSGAGLGLTVNSATYTRIGQMVFASLDVTYPVTANGSVIQIGGLPFNSAGTDPLCIARCTTATVLRGSTSPANNVIFLSDSTGAALANSVMSGQSIRGTVVYRV